MALDGLELVLCTIVDYDMGDGTKVYFSGRAVTTVLGRHLSIALAKYIASNYSFL